MTAITHLCKAMARPQSSLVVTSLAVMASVTIATGALLTSSAVQAACPFTDGATPSRSNVVKPDSTQQSDGVKLPDGMKQQSAIDVTGIAGLGAVIGLFTIALFYKVRRHSFESDILHQYPELEHPELALTALPKEALPLSAFDLEVVPVR